MKYKIYFSTIDAKFKFIVITDDIKLPELLGIINRIKSVFFDIKSYKYEQYYKYFCRRVIDKVYRFFKRVY